MLSRVCALSLCCGADAHETTKGVDYRDHILHSSQRNACYDGTPALAITISVTLAETLLEIFVYRQQK